MRIKDGFSVVNLQGQNTVVANAANSAELQNTIVLTDTSLFLWNMLKNGDVSKPQMLDALLDNFDISTVLALSDIDVFIRTMRENGLIEE